MGHPAVENETPFAFESLFVADEEGRPLFVPIIKATYAIGGVEGIRLSERQLPINPGGTFNAKPGESSYRYEPETAFLKLATDVALIGSARAPRPCTRVDVNLRVGPLSKRATVIGERYWVKSFGSFAVTTPEIFESIPLIYERAFGGRDKKECFEPRNPVGRGFHGKQAVVEDGTMLPNIEDPAHFICSPHDKPRPMGFGFVGSEWLPRSSFAGTYDEVWTRERMPLLPRDFDRRFFSASSPGLLAPGYLRGDEPVWIENASAHGTISFNLPGVYPPECKAQVTGRGDVCVQTNLDTVIINTDDDLVLLIWRGCLAMRNGPHDIVSIQIKTEGMSAPQVDR